MGSDVESTEDKGNYKAFAFPDSCAGLKFPARTKYERAVTSGLARRCPDERGTRGGPGLRAARKRGTEKRLFSGEEASQWTRHKPPPSSMVCPRC